jgi:hypothetical protein
MNNLDEATLCARSAPSMIALKHKTFPRGQDDD